MNHFYTNMLIRKHFFPAWPSRVMCVLVKQWIFSTINIFLYFRDLCCDIVHHQPDNGYKHELFSHFNQNVNLTDKSLIRYYHLITAMFLYHGMTFEITSDWGLDNNFLWNDPLWQQGGTSSIKKHHFCLSKALCTIHLAPMGIVNGTTSGIYIYQSCHS